jgi:hypothetical protein
VDRAGGSSTSAVAVTAGPFGPQLTQSPGRVDPTNTAWDHSRKPLAAEFLFNGHKLFIIANHFNSKLGDSPLYGHLQPPQFVTETQRNQQATVLAGFISSVLTLDNNANVVVLGDLNDFQFSNPVGILKAVGFVDLVETLPEDERYTYVFEGNSEVLDHILVSFGLAPSGVGPDYDVVHVNSEFADQASDHEPEVARFTLPLIEPNFIGTGRSGLVFNRSTQQFTGSILLENESQQAIRGPLQLSFEGLPAGVTLANATGTRNGIPYITLSQASLGAWERATVAVQFTDPSRAAVTYTLHVYQGEF